MKKFNALRDMQYPFTTITHTRKIVRGLIQREDGLFIMTHIVDHDQFGERNYYETPGGGIEDDETLFTALHREIQEECGITIDHLQPIGIVEDYYNLIQRKNVNHYVYARMTGTCQTTWTEGEKRRIKALPWLTLDAIMNHYASLPQHGISQLISQRELPVFQFFKKHQKKYEENV